MFPGMSKVDVQAYDYIAGFLLRFATDKEYLTVL